jgi:hypothetical protein
MRSLVVPGQPFCAEEVAETLPFVDPVPKIAKFIGLTELHCHFDVFETSFGSKLMRTFHLMSLRYP